MGAAALFVAEEVAAGDCSTVSMVVDVMVTRVETKNKSDWGS